MLGFGRWSSLIFLSSVAAIGIAAGTRGPVVAEQLAREGGLRQALLQRAGLVHLAPVPAQPYTAVKAAAWTAPTDTAIGQMQARVTGNPGDPLAYAAYAQLGSLYLQKARESGDPSYYARAEAALQQSLELSPDNVLAAVGMGGLLLARHEFADALGWAEQAIRQAPYGYVSYGIKGDALLELGRYEEAVASIQQMVDLRPDLTSLSRVSYARELHGDLPGAIEAMRRAVAAGSPGSEATHWARIHLAHLYFTTGRLDEADAEYAQTLAHLPEYVHGLAGRAGVAAARGDLKGAIALYERAQRAVPLPEHAVALRDVYLAAGNAAGAARQAELVRVIARLQRAGGMDVDLEMALFEVDLAADAKDARALEAALATARAAHARRPDSVHAQDVLAWALYRAGRPQEALPLARAALRLGSKDPLMLYHAGAIAAAAGEPAEARGYLETALGQNDRFHTRRAPEAKKLLEQLRKAA